MHARLLQVRLWRKKHERIERPPKAGPPLAENHEKKEYSKSKEHREKTFYFVISADKTIWTQIIEYQRQRYKNVG